MRWRDEKKDQEQRMGAANQVCLEHRSSSFQPSLAPHQAPESDLLLWLAFDTGWLTETEKATSLRVSPTWDP